MTKILVLDDEVLVLETITGILQGEGYTVESSRQTEGVLQRIADFNPDLVTLDLRFGDDEMAGVKVIQQIRGKYSREQLPIIVISGRGDAVKLKQLLKQGLDDYIYKPFKSEELLEKVQTSLARRQPSRENGRERIDTEMIGGQAIMDLMLKLERRAKAQLDTLILGENGTGKDMFAKLYHQLSPRQDQPFYHINCPAIPPTLFEAEIFGREKGAYSGAVFSRGKIEEAAGGIAFFNEIGELNLDVQAKLLHLFDTEKKTFCRVGGNQPIELDVIVIAATNRNLEQMVKEGRFRQDLFYRLKTEPIVLPPLRQRREDIPLLIDYFIKKYNQRFRKNIQPAAPSLAARISKLELSGNVRELEKGLEVAVGNCRGNNLAWEDFADFFPSHPDTLPQPGGEKSIYELDYLAMREYVKGKTEELEKDYLQYHLAQNGFNPTQTAVKLNMKNTKYIYERMRLLNIKLNEYN
ncbi:MAG: sigma-54 dependent transcriptional regulator [candidate division FCPU426 bacterium]